MSSNFTAGKCKKCGSEFRKIGGLADICGTCEFSVKTAKSTTDSLFAKFKKLAQSAADLTEKEFNRQRRELLKEFITAKARAMGIAPDERLTPTAAGAFVKAVADDLKDSGIDPHLLWEEKEELARVAATADWCSRNNVAMTTTLPQLGTSAVLRAAMQRPAGGWP